MTAFSSEYHVVEDEHKDTRGYNIAAILCAVMLVALTVTTIVLGRKAAYELETVPSFELAIDEGRYSDALDIYRSVQDDVLKTSPDSMTSNATRIQMLDDMQNIVRTRVDEICNRIISNRYVLTPSDINFLDSMKELTSSVVSERLYSICEVILCF